MQILDIILYGNNGNQRVLSFDTGRVNIITGDSKTGKTAIIDIVDYCLGSGEFRVADGVVREYVFWYAVRFQLKGGQILIARPNPTKYARSASDVFFLQGDNITTPKFEELIANLNVDTLLLKLANIIGIQEYTHQTESFSRPETPVTFKHSRFYCFQPQTDIDQRDFLFYNQKKDVWVEQAMKDTLPYFLGAIGSENVLFQRQLADKRRNVNRLEREMKDAQSIVDKTMGQVFELINEAKQVGLIALDLLAKDREEGISILQTISELDAIQDLSNVENEVLNELQSKMQSLSQKRNYINENIKATETYQKENRGFGNEAQQQVLRLESVNIFSLNKEVNNSQCPLCNQTLKVKIPTVEQINNSLLNLQKNLEITRKEQPKLKEYLDNLQKEKTDVNSEIHEIEKSISGIYKEKEQAQKFKDLNIRKGRVLGRISLYLESKVEINDFSDTRLKVNELKKEIENIQKLLSSDEKEDKLESILDQLSVQMTSWSKELELEFMDRIIKFDIKKLTLFIISAERKIPFNQTGSGENWVAYHLLIHFALHKYFVTNKRPVPNFLILDQLSQAYFPPEKDLKGTGEIEQSEDDKAIKRLFDFIFRRTEELEGGLQTIIIDHAKLNEEKFQSAIKEEWRKGIKLVPIDWIMET